MATPSIPSKMVDGGEMRVVDETTVLDDFRTRMCTAAEKLRWTRGYEDLQHELYHQVVSFWVKGILHTDMLASIEAETRRRAIDSRLRLGKRVLELQEAGGKGANSFNSSELMNAEFRGIAHHFPTIFPDIFSSETVAWELGLEHLDKPLRWTDSWDQATNPQLAQWARHCEALARSHPAAENSEKAKEKPTT